MFCENKLLSLLWKRSYPGQICQRPLQSERHPCLYKNLNIKDEWKRSKQNQNKVKHLTISTDAAGAEVVMAICHFPSSPPTQNFSHSLPALGSQSGKRSNIINLLKISCSRSDAISRVGLCGWQLGHSAVVIAAGIKLGVASPDEASGKDVAWCESHVWLFVTPCTVSCQAPLSIEFYR